MADDQEMLQAPLTLEQAVAQAIGQASMCWDPPPSDQVFDTVAAVKVRDDLVRFIQDREGANLGLASTLDLIVELRARAGIADAIGEAWPRHRPVDS